MSYRALNTERTRWQIDIYPRGRKGGRKRVNFSGDEQDAIEFEASLIREFANEIPKDPVMKQAIPEWLEYCTNNLAESTVTDIKKVNKNLLPFFGTIRFTRLNSGHIERYKTMRRGKVKDRTINKELSYFSGFLTWAGKSIYAPGFYFHVELIPKVESPKPVILSLSEVQAIIDNIEPHYLCILLLNYDTGLRRTSALNIKAEDVDLSNGTFRAIGKGGKHGTFAITTNRLWGALNYMVEKVKTGYLFVNPKTGKPYYSIRKALIRAAKKAGVKKRVYAHLFRHSFCTHGIRLGINLKTMQHALQHSTIKVTEKYINLDPEDHVAEMKKFTAVAERQRGAMIKVVGGKRFDSACATVVASHNNGLTIADASYCFEELYMTKKGNWFLVGEGGPMTSYAKNGERFGRDLVPLTADEARGWMERRNLVDQLEEHFGGEIEDA